MAETEAFKELMVKRRTIYQLKGEVPISKEEIQEIISHAILHVPSSFNSQSSRIIFLVGEEHGKYWDIVKEVLKGIVPGQAFATTEKKLGAFKGAYGTILFFVDQSTIKEYQEKFPLYADRFPTWGDESSGMHQWAIWTLLASKGVAANLQHYNPIVDELVTKQWNINPDWKLGAQLVIGAPAIAPFEKTFKPLEERFLTYGDAPAPLKN